MGSTLRHPFPLFLTAAAAVLFAAPAGAAPVCADPGPNTTICQTPGHSQITTSPNPALTDPFPAMYGGFGVGLRDIFAGW